MRTELVQTCLLIGAFAVAASSARASVLNLTELSSENLQVYMTLQNQAQTQVNGINDNGNPNGDFWIIGAEFCCTGSLPLFGPSQDGNFNYLDAVAWIEPGGDPNDLTGDEFNVMAFSPSGNRGVTQVVVWSDLTQSQVGAMFSRNGGFFNTCSVNGAYGPCPILTDGQSYDVPISLDVPNGPVLETLTVTFNDQGDASTPEPASITLVGVGLAGFILWWRKHRGAVFCSRVNGYRS